ncbi:MAG TPA: hypothetical protein VM431_07685 [Phycisphaerae bacterium]|nr:hypothetical protein [Phycisphaerae bacterium]
MSRKRRAVGLVWLLAAALVGHAHAEDAAPNQPQTYYVIPIKGVIGRHFTAGRMQACLKEAERLKPAVVVLELDTGGGDIIDAERIVDLIIAHKDLRFVAFVRKALSAGATIALACEKIFVAESATIGGAVSYSVGSDGIPQRLPADVAEKFQSVWRAVCRKAAEHGGHPTLIAEAMVDPAFALTTREEGGKPVFERDGQGKVLKAKGRILTLTAREAIDCRIAQAMVLDLQGIAQHLGMPNWKQTGERPEVQPAKGGVPQQLASDAFAAPDSLYEMLYQKVLSLGLTEKQTQLKRTKALEDWQAWLKRERVQGRGVQWTMVLVEASEGEMRMVPDTGDSQTGAYLKSMTAKLAGSVRGPSMTVELFTKIRPTIEFNLLGGFGGLRKVRGEYYQDREVAPGQKEYLDNLERQTRDYPLKVTAKAPNEPRVFRVVAWVSARYRDALGRVGPESDVVLSGKIGEVVPYLSDDGVLLVEIILDQCELMQEPAAGSSGAEEHADSNSRLKKQEVLRLLGLQRQAFLAAGTRGVDALKRALEAGESEDKAWDRVLEVQQQNARERAQTEQGDTATRGINFGRIIGTSPRDILNRGKDWNPD